MVYAQLLSIVQLVKLESAQAGLPHCLSHVYFPTLLAFQPMKTHLCKDKAVSVWRDAVLKR